jgi:formamidopyrimidine-DNA glycosylase
VPELSDVEGFRRYLTRYGADRRIESVSAEDPAMVRNSTPQSLGRALKGRRFRSPRRHGKWLIAPAEGPRVVFHFGMNGLLEFSSGPGEPHPHDRVVFGLEGGVLRFRDMRRFGGVWLLRPGEPLESVTGPLGPDALSVDADSFCAGLRGRRGGVKAALMDQTLIAGLGNLLSDEILWRARIDPRTACSELSAAAAKRIHARMGEVLRAANRHARVPGKEGWLTGARDEPEPRCPRCGRRLRKATVAGRTAAWCSRCQR